LKISKFSLTLIFFGVLFNFYSYVDAQFLPTKFPITSKIYTIAVTSDNTLLVGSANGHYLYMSKDKGESWTPLNLGWYYNPSDIICVLTNKNGLIVLLSNSPYGGSAFTTDGGSNWNTLNVQLGSSNDHYSSGAILSKDTIFFSGDNDDPFTRRGWIGRFIIGASNYNPLVLPASIFPGNLYSSIISTEDKYIFAINNESTQYEDYGSNSVLRSKDNGKSWDTVYGGKWSIYSNIKNVTSLNYCGTGTIFAGSAFGILRSTDYGNTWSIVDGVVSHYYMIGFIRGKSNKLYAGNSNGLFISIDNGSTWNLIDSNLNVTALAIDNDTCLYIGTNNQGLYKSDETNQVSSPGIIPDKYSLTQNYPNPFNPGTTIMYTIPKNTFVTLKIYDLMGREIKTLVNQAKSPGEYNVIFNSSNLPSGIYVYRIKAGNFVQSKKMTLIK
jgi:photosystem II stability/assembly factor-like uncharacterized protein